MTRDLLVETIHSKYIHHVANKPYLARAIKELQPAFESLASQVEEFVRVTHIFGMSEIEPILLPHCINASKRIIQIIISFSVYY